MFDIGIWEILVIGVVALLVVGPDEFPALVRKGGQWLGQARRFMSDVKSDLDQELQKVEEMKQLMAKEAKIAELHEMIDPSQPAVKVKSAEQAAVDTEAQDSASSTVKDTPVGDAHEHAKKISP